MPGRLAAGCDNFSDALPAKNEAARVITLPLTCNTLSPPRKMVADAEKAAPPSMPAPVTKASAPLGILDGVPLGPRTTPPFGGTGEA